MDTKSSFSNWKEKLRGMREVTGILSEDGQAKRITTKEDADVHITASREPGDNDIGPRETNRVLHSSSTDITDLTCGTEPIINVTGTLNVFSGEAGQTVIYGDQFNKTSPGQSSDHPATARQEFKVPEEINKDDKFDVTTCQRELRHFYLHTLCKIPQFPGVKQNYLKLDDIYTNLAMLINLPKPCAPIKIPLKSHHEIFTPRDKGVKSRTFPSISFSVLSSILLICVLVSFPFVSYIATFPSLFYLNVLFTPYFSNYLIILTPCLPIVLLTICKLPVQKTIGDIHDMSPPSRILVLGNPGCGKSVLTLKLAHDWAVKNPDSPLKNVELVFALNMRWMTPNTNLEDAIFQQLLPKDTKLSKTALRDYIEQNQSSCIIILDSFDEYGYNRDFGKVESGVHRILLNDCLRECQVLVTSRFWKAGEFDDLKDVYTQMQISGFSDANVKDYIFKFFSHDEVAGEKLLSYLVDHNLSPGMANVPLMTLLFCLYWKESGGGRDMPNKIGELYSGIFRLLQKQYLSKNIKEYINLPQLVIEAGKVALSGLWSSEDKLAFGLQEFVDKSSTQTLAAACKIGVLSVEQQDGGTATLLREDTHCNMTFETGDDNPSTFDLNKCVTFFHKSFQEKCAGEFLADLYNANPSEFETKMQYLDSATACMRVEMVLRFACGASLKVAHRIIQKLMQIFKSEFSPHLQRYNQERLDPEDTKQFQKFTEMCLQCYYECPDSADSHFLLNELLPDGQILFIGMSPYTSSAIGKYISCAKVIKSIKISAIPSPSSGGLLPRTGVIRKAYLLIQNTLKHRPSQQLELLYNQGMSYSDSSDFYNLCRTEVTNYFKDWQSSEGVNLTDILSSLDYSHGLDNLELDNTMLGRQMTTLQNVINHGSLFGLRTLVLTNNNLASEEVSNLLDSIPRNLPGLILLNISFNKARLSNIGDCLVMSRIERLLVMGMEAPAEDICDVVIKLPRFGSRMKTLYIHGNEIDDNTGSALADALSCASQLEKLSISVNKMKRNTHNKVIKAMRHLRSLTQLKIKSSPYLDDLFECLSGTIGSLPLLEVLRLYLSPGEVQQTTLGRLVPWHYTKDVKRTACHQFMSTLDTMPKMRELMLFNISLHRQDLVTLLSLCHRHNYTSLRYSRNLFPDDIDASQYDVLVFL